MVNRDDRDPKKERGDVGVGHRPSGTAAGERQLNKPQTTGREYRNLSEPSYKMVQEPDRTIPLRDGVKLYADVIRPEGGGKFPALVSASPYPRQIQNVGAPLGFVEAGATDFWVPRGYVHVIVNLRGTGGSEGTYSAFDAQEREDMYDIVEWAAAQEWCDGNVGMLGISYFAMTQLEAAVMRPPHLRAIFPVAVTVDFREAVYHNGVLSHGFIGAWLHAMGVLAATSPKIFRSLPVEAISVALKAQPVHERLAHANGEAILAILGEVIRGKYDAHPWDELYYALTVENPLDDEFWQARALTPLLKNINVPTYLGCDWSNVPLHLPGTFDALSGISKNVPTRVALMAPGGLAWPWESLHVEALAWYDHWLKGRDTGILEGPPIRYLVPGTEGWRTTDEWPPEGTVATDFALTTTGALANAEGEPGETSFLYIPPTQPAVKNANPQPLPSQLVWETEPLAQALEFVGEPVLTLDAAITASDTAWFATLQEVTPDGKTQDVTAGWQRAALQKDNLAVAVTPGKRVQYKIPLVTNARRFSQGNRIRLVIASEDGGKHPAMLGFLHTPSGIASKNTIYSSSRLTLPVVIQ